MSELESEKINVRRLPYTSLLQTWKFILLSAATIGLYPLWWFYKAWRFLGIKDGQRIHAATRTIFAMFFLYSLFKEILLYAKEKGYSRSYSPLLLTVGILAGALLAYSPYFLISLLQFVFFIPPLKALNFAKENSTEFKANWQNGFSSGQWILLAISGLYITLIVLVAVLDLDAYPIG